MAAPRGKSTQGITNYKLEVGKLVDQMQRMVEQGKSVKEIFEAVGGRVEELRTKHAQLSAAMKGGAARARDAAKSQKELDQANANLNLRLRALSATYKELERIENQILSTTRKEIAANAELAKSINKNASETKKAVSAEEQQRKLAQERLKQILKKNQALRRQGKENKRLKETIDKLNASSKKSNEVTKESTTRFGRFTKGVGSALGTLIRFATAGLAIQAALKAISFFTKDAVLAFVDFEKQLGNLSAVAGVSGDKLNKLKDTALSVAGETKFTASEIVGLQTELSKLGFTADEVIASTQAIAFAAQALGEDLSQVAEQVGKISNQFGLLAEESGQIADTLVTTINESALSLNTFGTAIQYVGPIARDLGLDLQQTAGAMAVLADNGFTASRIGTGLRGILTELGSTSVDVQSELKKLADRNISLSEAVQLVGKRNAAQLITLLENIDALEEGEDKYYQQGRAMEASATQALTLSGQMDILKASINEFQISLGEAIASGDRFLGFLGAISDEAQATVYGFKILKNVGAEGFLQDVEDVNNGVDATEIAIRRLAELKGISAEEVQEQIDLIKGIRGGLNDLREFFGNEATDAKGLGGGLFNWMLDDEFINAVDGYVAKINEQREAQEQSNIVSENRTYIDNEYAQLLKDMVLAEAQGIDKSEEATAIADEILRKRVAMNETIKAYKDLIENGDLTDAEVKAYEKAKLALEAQDSQLQQYMRRFFNFKTEADLEEPEINKRDARTFQEEIDKNEEATDALKRKFEIEEAINEAKKEFTKNSMLEIETNGKLIQENNKTIDVLEQKKKAIEEEIKAKDTSTKQGEYDVKIMNKEIKTLEKLIRKYKEKNDALAIDASTMEDVTKNTEKQLKALQKSYSDGDITGVDFKRQARALISQMSDDLYLAAGNDKDLIALATAIVDNFENPTDVDWNEILFYGIEEAISTTLGAIEGFNDTAFENTKNRLEAEKEAIKARYETEDYLAKQQFENGLINEAQYRRRQQQLRKKQIAEENALEKKLFEANQKKDRNDAKVDFLEAVASIIPTLIKEGIAEPTTLNIMAAITAASAAASYAAEVSAINQRKFYPKKFAQGGMVYGPSHQDGGVPFSVQGQGGYEMEGGEFIINKRAASLHRDLLEKINGSVKPNTTPSPTKFATGGIVTNSVTNIGQQSQESVNYLKTIAEATMTNAINSSKPVRAFVTSTDLRKDETARRIKDNNTTI